MSTIAPEQQALELREAGYALQEGALQADGTVLIHVIRPGIGRGKGKHYYSPEMLRENAGLWAGVKMYANHLSEKARRALEGLPRPIEHSAGRILESWWDGDVPANDRFEQGAVVARVRPVGIVKTLIEQDPGIVETSIAAQATATRPGNVSGQRVNIVEGIAQHPERPGMAQGSVDFVTEAGAGGKVLEAIQEAAEHAAEDEALLESLDDDELRAHIAENRPELAEALGIETTGGDEPQEEEDDVAELTPEALQEALAKPENLQVLSEIIDQRVEHKLDEARDEIIREAQAELQRGIDLRDMRDEAHALIEAAKLPEKFAAVAKRRFDLVGTTPTDALDAFDEIDSDGTIVKSASDRLREAVDSVIEEMRDLAGSVSATRVRGQGRGEQGDGSGTGDGEGGATSEQRVDPQTRSMLSEAGFTEDEINDAYGAPLQGVTG